MAQRVTYTKVTKNCDYAGARFEVLLDGEKIGEVCRERKETLHSAGNVRYATHSTVATNWFIEAQGYRDYGISNRTRMDAVIDLLTSKHDMSPTAAREAVGKTALY